MRNIEFLNNLNSVKYESMMHTPSTPPKKTPINTVLYKHPTEDIS